jgi:hypothetical protein
VLSGIEGGPDLDEQQQPTGGFRHPDEDDQLG